MVKVGGVQPAAVLPMNPEVADSKGEVKPRSKGLTFALHLFDRGRTNVGQ